MSRLPTIQTKDTKKPNVILQGTTHNEVINDPKVEIMLIVDTNESQETHKKRFRSVHAR